MPEFIAKESIPQIAGLELNGLRAANVLPGRIFERAKITSAGTPIYDLNGELLFYRTPVRRGDRRVAFADVAANPALGGPLLSTSTGFDWNERALRQEARAAAKKYRRSLTGTKIRFVAYSYPKIAVQFMRRGKEVLLLEIGSWTRVPRECDAERKRLEPGHFERWSLLDELPAAKKSANARKVGKRLAAWQGIKKTRVGRRFEPTVLVAEKFKPVVELVQLADTRKLHYSSRNSDHQVCYELRGQETNVWCVGASTQMLLDFYRYEYTQTRLAQALGLGTKSSPNGLPYARVNDVVTQIEALTSNALDATIYSNPSWSLFRNEIRANRPLISFVPGHSRTVAGYYRSLIYLPGQQPFRGLLVYDPWPPNAGVITSWENFDTQTYQYAYTAKVKLI